MYKKYRCSYKHISNSRRNILKWFAAFERVVFLQSNLWKIANRSLFPNTLPNMNHYFVFKLMLKALMLLHFLVNRMEFFVFSHIHNITSPQYKDGWMEFMIRLNSFGIEITSLSMRPAGYFIIVCQRRRSPNTSYAQQTGTVSSLTQWKIQNAAKDEISSFGNRPCHMMRWNRAFFCDFELLEASKTIVDHRMTLSRSSVPSQLLTMKYFYNLQRCLLLWWHDSEISNWEFAISYHITTF